MKPIVAPDGGAPRGHYSQAIQAGDTVYLSAQLPVAPGEAPDPSATLEEQTLQVLSNALAIVEAAGGTRESLVRLTIYVTDMDDWTEVNRVYARFMGDHKPARGVLHVASLHLGFRVALDAIAVVAES